MSRWHRTEFDFFPEHAFQRRPCGGMTLEGGGGGNSQASASQNLATMMQMQTTQDQLNWAKEVYAQEAPQREATTALANQVSQAQLDQMRQQTAIAAQAQQDYNEIYRPIEQRLASEAENYDTPEKRAAASAEAVASVEKNLAQQRGSTMREMERAGVDPSSGKVADMQTSLDLNAAKLKAGAGNAASKAVETIGYARRMDAASLGRGIASSQGTNAALASTLGSQSVGSSAQGIAAAQSGNAGMQAAYGNAIQGYGAAANSYGNMASAQQQAAASRSASAAAGVGAVATVAVVI